MSITYFYCLFVCVYNKSLYRPSEIHYSIIVYGKNLFFGQKYLTFFFLIYFAE